jgi:hypothetical protein
MPWTFAPLVGPQIGPAGARLELRLTSNRSLTVRDRVVEVRTDVVAVELTDFVAAGDAAGVRLSWHASRDARFHVERSIRAAGPFECLTAAPLAAADGAFEFFDAGAGESSWYRLIALDARAEARSFGPYEARRNPPARIHLRGAVPNPFNPSTEIRFELPRAARISLRIVDARGRIAAVLLDGALRAAGTHVVPWHAREAASGVYWVQLDTPGARHTARAVLVR